MVIFMVAIVAVSESKSDYDRIEITFGVLYCTSYQSPNQTMIGLK